MVGRVQARFLFFLILKLPLDEAKNQHLKGQKQKWKKHQKRANVQNARRGWRKKKCMRKWDYPYS